MIDAAKWLRPRKLRSSFSYRTSSLRNRLNQLCATSTTQRLAPFRDVALRLSFLPSAFDMGDVAMFLNDAQRGRSGIASISTQMLVRRSGGSGAHHDGIEDRRHLGDIMPIGSGHDDRQRDATTVHQQMALAPIFFPDPSGLARRLPVPLALSSSLRQCSAIARQCLPTRRTRRTRLSTGLQRRQLSPTPESACDCAGAAVALCRERLPLAARSQHVNNGLEHQARILWLAAATGFAHIFLLHRAAASGSTVRRAPRMHRKLPMTPTLPFAIALSHARPHRDGKKVYSFIYG